MVWNYGLWLRIQGSQAWMRKEVPRKSFPVRHALRIKAMYSITGDKDKHATASLTGYAVTK